MSVVDDLKNKKKLCAAQFFVLTKEIWVCIFRLLEWKYSTLVFHMGY